MAKLIFILGGVRSGKSRYAQELAKKIGQKVVFIATASAADAEMKKRIKLHQLSRPREWGLIEENRDISTVLTGLKNKYEIALIDCLGLLVSNLLTANLKDKQIIAGIEKLILTILKASHSTILVSNEVGYGIVPDNPLARRFRDLLGLANQMIAQQADEVIMMQAGIPLKIK